MLDKPLVIYHADCADGFTSAWVMVRAMKREGIEVELHRGIYGQPPPDTCGRNVWFLDFTYGRPVMEPMAGNANRIHILDHHETAWKEYGIFLDDVNPSVSTKFGANFFVEFHKNKSGAGITWDYFNNTFRGNDGLAPDTEASLLVSYVQDRDLWKFNLRDSRAINAWVFSYDYTMENWDRLAAALNSRASYGNAVMQGEAIERKHFKDIHEFLASNTGFTHLDGVEVPCANVPYIWASDAANILAEGHPFAATYYDDSNGNLVYSLRSKEGGSNVGTIAKSYGGGGHAHAAGFRSIAGHKPTKKL